MYFETFFSKHNKYILNKLQQLIHSPRLKNIITVMEGAFKNMNNWIRSNLHRNLIKYVTDSQMHTTNNAIQVTNKLMKQGVKQNGIQYYNIHQALILSDLVTESDIYDNLSYPSFVDWEIEKTPEANPKKLEFNINKSETDLKKIDFNINVNEDEIDDMNNKEVVHPSGDLIDDNYSNIEDHETQHKRINRNNSFYNLIENELQSSP